MVLHIRYEVVKIINFLDVGNAWIERIDGLPEGWSAFAAESMLEAVAVGPHPLGVGRPLPRPARSPL